MGGKMNKRYIFLALGVFLVLGGGVVVWKITKTDESNQDINNRSASRAPAVEFEVYDGSSESGPTTQEVWWRFFVKRYFAEDYADEVVVKITAGTKSHIRGIVHLVGEEEKIFLAFNDQGVWRLAFEGFAPILCEPMEAYNFPQKMIADCQSALTIPAKPGDPFSVFLESNPTTGYHWEADFDETMVEFRESFFVPTVVEEGVVGSGGTETFRFTALRKGETKITFSYRRSWEEEAIEERVYPVVISSD